jgi:hypothetical protein
MLFPDRFPRSVDIPPQARQMIPLVYYALPLDRECGWMLRASQYAALAAALTARGAALRTSGAQWAGA